MEEIRFADFLKSHPQLAWNLGYMPKSECRCLVVPHYVADNGRSDTPLPIGRPTTKTPKQVQGLPVFIKKAMRWQ